MTVSNRGHKNDFSIEQFHAPFVRVKSRISKAVPFLHRKPVRCGFFPYCALLLEHDRTCQHRPADAIPLSHFTFGASKVMPFCVCTALMTLPSSPFTKCTLAFTTRHSKLSAAVGKM